MSLRIILNILEKCYSDLDEKPTRNTLEYVQKTNTLGNLSNTIQALGRWVGHK